MHISISELKAAIQEKQDIVLVDVRTLEEHQAFNIGGLFIPLNELPQRLNEIDQTKAVVTYCRSGGRSLMAVNILLAAGFTSVKSLDGGMMAWQSI